MAGRRDSSGLSLHRLRAPTDYHFVNTSSQRAEILGATLLGAYDHRLRDVNDGYALGYYPHNRKS
jgi:hypothetical protein